MSNTQISSGKDKPRLRRKKLLIVVAIVIVVVAVIGSLAYVAYRPGSPPLAPSGPNVTIWDTGFCSNSGNCGYSPTAKNTTIGTSITWTNTGGQAHTVTECTTADTSTACPNGSGANTSGARAFDSNTQYSSGFRRDEKFTFALSNTGTYYYYCTLHPWMHGTVVVG